jgi:phosphoribosylformimino-5-aminoimidazole carboxamide ribotide isomerase
MGMTKMSVIASGGVGSMDDIQKLKEINVHACIVGKAIYDGKLDLPAAIKAGAN